MHWPFKPAMLLPLIAIVSACSGGSIASQTLPQSNSVLSRTTSQTAALTGGNVTSQLSGLSLHAPRPDEISAFKDMARMFPELAGKTFAALTSVGYDMPDPNDEIGMAPPGSTNPYICGMTYNGVKYVTYWTGNPLDIPPNCTNTGIFRRTYSVPGTEAAGAYISLPSATSGPITLPTGSTYTGYIYIEGWPGANTGNSEAGLGWSAGDKDYVPYLRTNNPKGYVSLGYAVSPQTNFYMRVGAVSDPTETTTQTTTNTPKGTSCSGGCEALTIVFPVVTSCPQGTQQNAQYCMDVERLLANGWSMDCCTFARQTTIATPSYSYLGGYEFGNIAWTQAKTDYHDNSKGPPNQGVPFKYLGDQSYPSSTSFVVPMGGGPNSPTAETDSLYLPTSY